MKAPLLSHVGIVVVDFDAAVRQYTSLLGQEPTKITEVTAMGVRVAIFEGANPLGGHVELLSPISEDNSIARFLERRGEGLHHICIGVHDIEARLREYKAGGFRLIDETPRIGALGHKIAFVHPSAGNGVLIELEEIETEDS